MGLPEAGILPAGTEPSMRAHDSISPQCRQRPSVGSSRPLAQWLRSIVQSHRDAHRAEAMYRDLSRLCDSALDRRGLSRQHVLQRVFDCLTGGEP
jgi:hypothetical protein